VDISPVLQTHNMEEFTLRTINLTLLFLMLKEMYLLSNLKISKALKKVFFDIFLLKQVMRILKLTKDYNQVATRFYEWFIRIKSTA